MSTEGKCLIKVAAESSIQDALHQSSAGAPISPTNTTSLKDDESSDASSDTESDNDGPLSEEELVSFDGTEKASESVEGAVKAKLDPDELKLSGSIDDAPQPDVNSKPSEGGVVEAQTDAEEQKLSGSIDDTSLPDVNSKPIEGGVVEALTDTEEQKLSSSIDDTSLPNVNSKAIEGGVVEAQTDAEEQELSGSIDDASLPDGKSKPSDDEELGGSDDEQSECSDDVNCSDHLKDKTSAYCNTCDKQICLRCIIGAHRQHDFIPFEDKIEAQRSELSESLNEVGDLKKNVIIAKTEQELAKFKLSETADALRDELLQKKEKSLKNLECQFEKEVGKLTEHYSAQKKRVEKLSAEKLQYIHGLLERETASSNTRLKDCAQVLEAAESLAKTSMDAGPRESLTKIRSTTSAARKSVEDLKATKETLEVVPTLPVDDNTDIEKLGDLHAKVVNGIAQEAESQTAITSNQLEVCRNRIQSLTKKSTSDLFDTEKTGNVALSTASRDACRDYGAGIPTAPTPIQAPDVSKPILWSTTGSGPGVVFTTKGEAKALAQLVGGGSNVTVGVFHKRSTLMIAKKPVSLYAFIACKCVYPTAVDNKDESALRGSRYFLPIDGNMKDLLHGIKFLADAIFTAWPNEDPIGENMTVREWAEKYPSQTVLYVRGTIRIDN